MRIITTFLFCLIVKFVFGQKPTLQQIWIGDSLEYLSLDSIHATFQFSGKNSYHDRKGYHILGDTLRLQDLFSYLGETSKTLLQKNYDYLISTNKKGISLSAINEDALRLAGYRKLVQYKPIHSIYKKTFNFDSLKFTSTTCYGRCPEMTILIKGNHLFFSGGRYAIKQGNFKAEIADTLYLQLKDFLRKSSIEKIVNWEQKIYDAPFYTLTVFFDNKQKYIEGYELPLVTKDLLRYLLDLPKKVERTLK